MTDIQLSDVRKAIRAAFKNHPVCVRYILFRLLQFL